MRIIAGEARGRKLLSPEGLNTRPSSDRLKEALFGNIQFGLKGAVVLDLFSGSGAMGLEAVSRGAAMAYCNDNNAASVRCIVENVQNLGFTDRVQVSQKDFAAAIGDLAARGVKFDYVFLDPPYGEDAGERALERIAAAGLLMEEGVLFWEHERDFPVPLSKLQDWGYELRKTKKYGKAGLTALALAVSGEGEEAL